MTRRLLLWDVDGTLLRAGDLGAAVFDRAIEAVIGELPAQRVRMSGKTDPQIVREYLDMVGSEDPSHLHTVLGLLESELAAAAEQLAEEGSVCAGVAKLLEEIHGHDTVHQSVLTGNIAPNAVVKLSAFGLERWLDLEVGAYGSDHADRRVLVPIALGRMKELRGVELEPSDVWVIGDTPRDYECAVAGGAHCLLVATGRYSLDELAECRPDAVLQDLSDTAAAFELLTGGL